MRYASEELQIEQGLVLFPFLENVVRGWEGEGAEKGGLEEEYGETDGEARERRELVVGVVGINTALVGIESWRKKYQYQILKAWH
jgi:hypothetical protein